MRYALVGFGLSNKYAAQFLRKIGEQVFVSESGKLSQEDKAFLEESGIEYEEGQNSERILQADVILTSPSVPYNHPILMKARESGIKVETEITYFMRFLDWDPSTIAITGSVGKSTTVAMTNHLISKTKTSQISGNFGIPIAQILLENKRPEYLVIEISSFQLYWAEYFKPKIAAITNIYPNHLDWHPSMEHYVESKMKITKWQDNEDYFVYNPRDLETFKRLALVQAKRVPATVDFSIDEIPFHIRTRQNIENIAMAKTIVKVLGLPFQMSFLDDFTPLPHRMEYVTTWNGVHFYNDSKATNAAAVIKALENFDTNVILILAGKGKNEDYTNLAEEIKKRCKFVALVGPIADAVEPYLAAREITFRRYENIEGAVSDICSFAQPGDVVLLSPGGASYDRYRNFEERGEHFKSVVRTLVEQM
ncbi:UDP-N-acetylmuramoyl-L-alanine--D-glutamate ligase [Fervidobacterium thailandense]|uniref:UDP-N-acetylmuramoylalanine--D-glutamate ligase n=1 Tax=Fervidobacterium thailandense TaxID=1008305 RepID=A0A1E3G475_9BACT|nr:UDP-N-acetylmuramoyl-L-alanine--D-glutamate ligase [Fervidobacterium thailandense]ODN31047.1 UDP-N-acetylmuramoylalanine--D-glutamate ligase [Fervidobacterium thailandense]